MLPPDPRSKWPSLVSQAWGFSFPSIGALNISFSFRLVVGASPSGGDTTGLETPACHALCGRARAGGQVEDAASISNRYNAGPSLNDIERLDDVELSEKASTSSVVFRNRGPSPYVPQHEVAEAIITTLDNTGPFSPFDSSAVPPQKTSTSVLHDGNIPRPYDILFNKAAENVVTKADVKNAFRHTDLMGFDSMDDYTMSEHAKNHVAEPRLRDASVDSVHGCNSLMPRHGNWHLAEPYNNERRHDRARDYRSPMIEDAPYDVSQPRVSKPRDTAKPHVESVRYYDDLEYNSAIHKGTRLEPYGNNARYDYGQHCDRIMLDHVNNARYDSVQQFINPIPLRMVNPSPPFALCPPPPPPPVLSSQSPSPLFLPHPLLPLQSPTSPSQSPSARPLLTPLGNASSSRTIQLTPRPHNTNGKRPCSPYLEGEDKVARRCRFLESNQFTALNRPYPSLQLTTFDPEDNYTALYNTSSSQSTCSA